MGEKKNNGSGHKEELHILAMRDYENKYILKMNMGEMRNKGQQII